MESQLRTMDNQVDYSTVSLNINEVTILTPTKPDSFLVRIQTGFMKNIENVFAGLLDFVIWFIASVPIFILVAIIGFIIGIFIKLISKKAKNKKAAKIQAINSVPTDSTEADQKTD